MESALRGSPQDAFSLYRYYFQLADVENEKYWAMIAAENGHSIAQRNYGGLLLQYGNREEKLRGQFWLATAYRCGNDEPPTESHEK